MSDKEDLRRRFDQAIEAWHASPYDFDEFGPMRKVSGSGQGAAAYGRGAAYVAENPKISGPGDSKYMKEFSQHPSLQGNHRWQFKHRNDPHPDWEDLTTDAYDDEAKPDTIYNGARHDFGRTWVLSHLSNHDMQRDPQALDLLRDMIRAGKDRQTINPKRRGSIVEDLTAFMNQRLWWIPDDAKRTEYDDNHATMVADYLEKHADKELRHIKEEGKQGPFSYKVAVHLKPETMLDWDEVIGDHHKDAKTKIAQAYDQHVGLPQKSGDGKVNYMEASDGAGVYREFVKALGGDYAASEALFNAGIHGIRYKDAGSRKALDTYIDGVKVEKDWKHPSLPREVAQAIRYAAEQTDIHTDLLTALRKRHDDIYHATRQSPDDYRFAIEWVKDGQVKVETRPSKPTYNYVIFHPDFVEAMAQYNIKGEKIRDIGPGVHLKTADHDPFKGEDK